MKYVPGPWIGIAVPGAAVVFEPGVSAEQLDGLKQALHERGIEGFTDAVTLLNAAAGTPLPGFAAVSVLDGEMRVAARGPAVVVELDAQAPRTRDGSIPIDGVFETWRGASAVRVVAANADPDAPGLLSLDSGVVFAASIDVELSAGPTPAPESAPAPAERPAATPMETMIPDFTQDVSVAAEPAVPPLPSPSVDAENGAGESDDDAALDLTFGDIWGATLSIDELGNVAASQSPSHGGSARGVAPPVPPAPSAPLASPAPPAPPAPPATPGAPTGAVPSSQQARPLPAGLIDGIPDVVRGPVSTDPGSAVSGAAAVPVPVTSPQPRLGDHDGSTVSVADMLAMQSGPPSAPIHTGSGSFSQRRRGRAHVSTGQVIEIDRTIIVGRLPRASRITGQPPQLVAVPSPQQDISRNHVEIRLEGSAVVVVDLNTTNGTVLHRVGADAERLHPGEPTVVRDGDVIDLGDSVTVTFEGIA